MRIIENGNVALENPKNISSQYIDNSSYLGLDNTEPPRRDSTENKVKSLNWNNINTNDNRSSRIESNSSLEIKVDPGVCNKQYRISSNAVNLTTSENENLDNKNNYSDIRWNNYKSEANDSPDTTPVDEERAFEHSYSDEMSEKSALPVPRGIVNPNYPGFQHLAHTLQDYSSTIEHFYNSDNDMTDDDIDIEINELNSNDIKTIRENENINNNVENICMKKSCNSELIFMETQSDNVANDMPDLLKTITQNNNNVDSMNYEFSCSATDIENNFHAKDIIGDFNKEVEDEIRQLLNYNINIEDDLEELRKDIKDSLAKPIENTINNISDVVNHVIKKLVENDGHDKDDEFSELINDQEMEDISDINKENETNIRTEMNISRPTFLLIENNIDNKIADAILSDGKEEINICEDEYDTEHLSHNVENTIKQLSTELRKIIPKLNEMRERDILWNENTKKKQALTDGNSNNIILPDSSNFTSKCNSFLQIQEDNMKLKPHNNFQSTIKAVIEPHTRQSSTKSKIKSQSNASVRKNDNYKESDFESFDVYNIETALPKLDLDAIENHIKAAKDAERRKRNDREEIRKRLAMGVDSDEYYSLGHIDRPGKKPSLHQRLQNGKNLQICFMNETASDNESQASDIEKNSNCNSKSSSQTSLFSKNSYNHPYQTRPLSVNITKHEKNSNTPTGVKLRPTSLTLKSSKSRSSQSLGHIELRESDFFALQATLQTEARIALAQAKEMARIQMERERHARAVSPVTEMLRRSMEKASAPLAPDRRRVSRQLLTDMNIAQLQVIVNELHSQIESLNDSLVKLLMARDELHMGQDSMLVDIEDLTRYLGVKEQTKKTKGPTKSGVKRLTSLVHK